MPLQRPDEIIWEDILGQPITVDTMVAVMGRAPTNRSLATAALDYAWDIIDELLPRDDKLEDVTDPDLMRYAVRAIVHLADRLMDLEKAEKARARGINSETIGSYSWQLRQSSRGTNSNQPGTAETNAVIRAYPTGVFWTDEFLRKMGVEESMAAMMFSARGHDLDDNSRMHWIRTEDGTLIGTYHARRIIYGTDPNVSDTRLRLEWVTN